MMIEATTQEDYIERYQKTFTRIVQFVFKLSLIDNHIVTWNNM